MSGKVSQNRDSYDLQIKERLTNVNGVVLYVDEENAFLDVRHDSFPDSKTKVVVSVDVLRKSSGFGAAVEDMDDYLSFADEVLVDIERGESSLRSVSLPPASSSSSSPWSASSSSSSVSRMWLCPARRPESYDSLIDYVSRTRPPGWSQQKHCHIPPRRWGELITIISDVLRSWSRVPVHLFRRIVDECDRGDDFGGVFGLYIKTDGDLLSFLRTAPQYFFVDERMRLCIYQGFSLTDFESGMEKICLEIPKKDRKYSQMNNIRVISDVKVSISALKPMLKRARNRLNKGESPGLVIAVDCLGVDSGRSGAMSLVQVASMTGVVYLFDVLRCPRIFRDGLLAEILENDAVLKVVYDCKELATNLFEQFDVILNNVFDISIAYGVLQDQCMVTARGEDRDRTRVGLQEIYEMVGEEFTVDDQGKQSPLRDTIHGKVLMERPLTEDEQTHAASQVYHLIPNVSRTLHRLIQLSWRGVMKARCDATIRECTVNGREKDLGP